MTVIEAVAETRVSSIDVAVTTALPLPAPGADVTTPALETCTTEVLELFQVTPCGVPGPETVATSANDVTKRGSGVDPPAGRALI